MTNVEIVVEDEPPDGQPLLGLYRGVPLPRRSSTDSGVLPDKISIFGGWSAFVFGASRPWRMTARRRQRTGNLSRLLLPTCSLGAGSTSVATFHSVGNPLLRCGAGRQRAPRRAVGQARLDRSYCWSRTAGRRPSVDVSRAVTAGQGGVAVTAGPVCALVSCAAVWLHPAGARGSQWRDPGQRRQSARHLWGLTQAPCD